MGLRIPTISRRHQLFTLLTISISSLLLLFLVTRKLTETAIPTPQNATPSESSLDVPPTYQKLLQWERDLPQHHRLLPYPEGRQGRYVKFTNQIKGLGWNNVFNEVLMNSHLAHESNRAYVFQDYVWKRDYYSWPESQWGQDPPRTPLNALIAGPAAGGPWEPGDKSPRAVSEEWFDIVCPPRERRVINTRDVKPAVRNSPGDEIFAHWAKLLGEAFERCIEITGDPEDPFPQTFDLWLWGTSRILPLWDSFSKSPTSRLLATSPIARAAVAHNEHLFLPRGPQPPHRPSHPPYERMMAMHVRRGDYQSHCFKFSNHQSTFYSWNLLAVLPDPFVLPEGVQYNTTEYHDAYFARCLPSFEAIIQKAHDSREDYARTTKGRQKTLDVMYLLTNEHSEWLDRMKDTLGRDGWHTIVTSNDLELDNEQKDVSMSVDQDIARQAAVFIGNGFSSFSSNIVHQRLVDGKDASTIRFW